MIRDEVENTMEDFSRRNFLLTALAAGAAPDLLGANPAVEPKRKIKLGLVGCGGRGRWLANFFVKHGGYEISAVADYFPERSKQVGETFNVPAARQFSGLSSCDKLLECGVDAVALINIPHFQPDQAMKAVEAGCHVFAAKPVAVDAPGALKVQAAGKLATQKNLCHLVDYQMGTDPVNIEVVNRIHEGGAGKLGHIDSIGFSNPWGDLALNTAEERLKRWLPVTALSGDVMIEFSIHTINTVLWIAQARPVKASGISRICRPNPMNDFHEVYLTTYEFGDGLVWTHRCQSLRNQLPWQIQANVYGDRATALVSYKDKSYLRGGPKHYVGKVTSLYDQGAIRNIATFYENILQGNFGNETAQQAGDDALTGVLGREACRRKTMMTMDELIRENRSLEFDTTGLKA